MDGERRRPSPNPHLLVPEGTAVMTERNPDLVHHETCQAEFTVQPSASFGEDVYSFSKDDVVRVVRLLLEALETAFFLCNIFMERYGLAKIFDIVNQIMPTAYVYNTSYWVFYKSQQGNSICVCERFGIRCSHRKNNCHFVNLDPLPENIQSYFAIPITGKLYPTEANVTVTPVMSDVLRAYEVKIDLVVQQLVVNANGFSLPNDEKVTLSIESRYILTPEHHALNEMALLFSPHPMTQYVYSSYFENLNQFHLFLNAHRWEMHVPRTYTMVSTDLPKFTVIPVNMELPVYNANLATSYPFGHYDEYERQINSQYRSFGINVRGGPFQKADHRSQLFLFYTRNYDLVRGNRYHATPERPTRHFGPLRNSTSGCSRLPDFYSSKFKRRQPAQTVQLPRKGTNASASAVPQNRNEQRQASSRTFDPTFQKQKKVNAEDKAENAEHNFLGSDYDVMFPSLPQSGCSRPQKRTSDGDHKNKTRDVEEPSTVIVTDEQEDSDDEIIVDEMNNATNSRTNGDAIAEEFEDDVIVIDHEETWHIINDMINGEVKPVVAEINDYQDVVITTDDNDPYKPSTSGVSKK